MAYELTCWECSGHRYCKSFIRCLGGHHFFRQGQPTIPTPEGGASGLAWAEGTLWVGQHRKRKIHQVDPQTGAILRTIDSNRFVTGVTWVGGELWHGTWEAEESELRRIDPQSGEVLEQIDMPAGIAISDGGTSL